MRLARARFTRIAARALVRAIAAALFVAEHIGPRQRPSGSDQEVILTGGFDSANWALTHLRPLASNPGCRRVYVVSNLPLPAEPRIVPIYAPAWLVRVAGADPARLMTFLWHALRLRPQVVGGFHLLINGLAALVVARLIGARALYLCGGGAREVLGGGAFGGNRLFGRLEKPDPVLERVLIGFVDRFDLVAVTGTNTLKFFRDNGVQAPCTVKVGCSVVGLRSSDPKAATIDVVTVTRLVPIKRIDRLLRVLQAVRRSYPKLRATIVGDGVLRGELEQLAARLGLADCVAFVGYRDDVGDWLGRSRVFALTSDSEGLPIAVLEAMGCGVPPVASRVGDLGDLVECGVNGYLVEPADEARFADRVTDLLLDEQRRLEFGRAARAAAAPHGLNKAAKCWDVLFAGEQRQ